MTKHTPLQEAMTLACIAKALQRIIETPPNAGREAFELIQKQFEQAYEAINGHNPGEIKNAALI
jgi:hypothetical protein